MEYRIRIKGHLEASWQTWFAPLELSREPAGTSLLSGVLPDQPALVRVLLKLHHLSLTLLSVECLEGLAEAQGQPQGDT